MAWKKKGVEVPLSPTTETIKQEIEREEPELNAIVAELPQVPVRKIRGDDGQLYNLTTINEAMQEIVDGIRELLKRTE